jgi:HYR domain
MLTVELHYGAPSPEKPAGATVRRAFVGAASTGLSGRQLLDNDVSLDGTGIAWTISTPSSISSWNHWAEVTDLVKPKIDAADAGLIDFTVGEVNTAGIDGEILAVIFDDPNQTTINTVVFLFGAQQVQGDTFNVGLSDPIDLSNPNLKLDMSLGISFGFITGSTVNQFSTVDVNGTRVTSSAGGQDDGASANGALLTVGGIGDTDANPPPNTTTPPGPVDNYRFDDELYDLKPFVHTGDTAITVLTTNPSNDDNIFFSALFIGSAAAIVGEGIVLGPVTATVNVGTVQTATATVQDANGKPVVARDVTFDVVSGPNKGKGAVIATDTSGKAVFSYTSDGGAGTDEIQASFVDSTGKVDTSNTAIREWTSVVSVPVPVCHDVTRAVGDSCTVDVMPADVGAGTTDPDGDPLSLALNPVGPFALGPTAVTMTASDNSGLSASCSATVTAIDTTAPSLKVPAGASATCAGPAGLPVTFAVSAADNCGSASPTCVDSTGRSVASGATFAVGTTTVTCSATDTSGNVGSGSFPVVVTGDTQPPVIQCNAVGPVSGSACFTATASDACSGTATPTIVAYSCWATDAKGRKIENKRNCSVSVSGARLTIKNTGCQTGSIEWTVQATDAAGNKATQLCSVQVTPKRIARP